MFLLWCENNIRDNYLSKSTCGSNKYGVLKLDIKLSPSRYKQEWEWPNTINFEIYHKKECAIASFKAQGYNYDPFCNETPSDNSNNNTSADFDGGLKIKNDVWKCINIFLRDNGYVLLSYKLNKPQTWVAIGEIVNGEKTEFAFDANYTAYHRTREGERIIKKGKWHCADNNTSFIIKWDNGKIYDPKEALHPWLNDFFEI